MSRSIKAVLDTNVFVSGLIHPSGIPGQILKALKASRFQLITSQSINEEILSVLNRPRIRERYKLTERILFDISFVLWKEGELVTKLPDIKLSKDPHDNKFLAAALGGKADYVVTGDIKDLLSLREVEGVKIITPEQFLQVLKQSGIES